MVLPIHDILLVSNSNICPNWTPFYNQVRKIRTLVLVSSNYFNSPSFDSVFVSSFLSRLPSLSSPRRRYDERYDDDVPVDEPVDVVDDVDEAEDIKDGIPLLVLIVLGVEVLILLEVLEPEVRRPREEYTEIL